jgi:hypothetical protein
MRNIAKPYHFCYSSTGSDIPVKCAVNSPKKQKIEPAHNYLSFFLSLHGLDLMMLMGSLKHASYIMLGAWSFSIFLASLPLFGISDYRKEGIF